MEPGSSARMPWRKIATVCVPQTSISRTGRPIARASAAMPCESSSIVGADMGTHYSTREGEMPRTSGEPRRAGEPTILDDSARGLVSY